MLARSTELWDRHVSAPTAGHLQANSQADLGQAVQLVSVAVASNKKNTTGMSVLRRDRADLLVSVAVAPTVSGTFASKLTGRSGTGSAVGLRSGC